MLMEIMDKDGNGSIDFDEFVMGCVYLYRRRKEAQGQPLSAESRAAINAVCSVGVYCAHLSAQGLVVGR